MDEIELCMSRIDDLHKAQLEDWQITEKRYDKWYDTTIGDVKAVRNYILSVLGFAFSVLLGLLSVDQITISQFYLYLLFDIVVGLIVFIIFEMLSRFYSKIYESIMNAIYLAQDNIAHSQAYFNRLIIESPGLEIQVLKNYFNFIMVITGASIIPFIDALNQIAKSRWIREDDKKNIVESIVYLKNAVEKGISLYGSLNKSGLHENLNKFIEKQFTEYKK